MQVFKNIPFGNKVGFTHDAETAKYAVAYQQVRYIMAEDMARVLSRWYTEKEGITGLRTGSNSKPSISEWYRSLTTEERKQIETIDL